MRKFLTITRFGITASVAVARRAAKTAVGFCLAVTFACLGSASAQTVAQELAPTATGARGQSLVTFASTGGTLQSVANMPTVDAGYSLSDDRSRVQPASFGAPAAGGYLGNDVCSPGCDVNYYFNYEALWLRREDDSRFTLSRGNFMPDFEYEFGGRYTAGNLLDCVNGWEVTYVGPYDWNRFSQTAAGTSNHQSNLRALNGYVASDISAFNSADVHVQSYNTRMQSFEVNRRWWTWDVLSTMIGIRYVDYEEDFRFYSSRAGTGIGLLAEDVDNQMVGVQVGGDLLYPVGLRSNIGFRGKGGLYANFAERAAFLSNAGTTLINSGDTDVDFAGVIEMGVFGNYQIVPSVRLTAAYEFWYMPGMATVPEQGPSLISPATGTTVFQSDDVVLHGGSVGLQVLFRILPNRNTPQLIGETRTRCTQCTAFFC